MNFRRNWFTDRALIIFLFLLTNNYVAINVVVTVNVYFNSCVEIKEGGSLRTHFGPKFFKVFKINKGQSLKQHDTTTISQQVLPYIIVQQESSLQGRKCAARNFIKNWRKKNKKFRILEFTLFGPFC